MNINEYEFSNVVRPLVMKRDGYSCKSCGVRDKTIVYNNARGVYVECDEFTAEWAKANGKSVFKVVLEVVQVDPTIDSFAPSNLVTYCKKCKHKAHRLLKRKKIQAFKGVMEWEKKYTLPGKNLNTLTVITAVRSLIEEDTGVTISTKKIKELILLITNN